MPFIQGADRCQMRAASLDMLVADECLARVIDAFVDSLDLVELGFIHADAASEGRPAYDASSLLKLYVYGHYEGIRSSRKLERACEVNMEVCWLLRGMRPDYRTIARFRHENATRLKSVFRAFTERAFEILKAGFISIDGSKFRASCSKDRNFTAAKLDDRITRLANHIDEYMRQLDREDKKENAEEERPNAFSEEELNRKVEEARERLALYEGYRDAMQQSGAGQISVTDPDARLMKTQYGFAVSYNVQTAVDSNTHLIRDYNATNQVTDHGQLAETAAAIKAEMPDQVLDIVADKGCNSSADMVKCLENGMVPNVILPDGQDEYVLETAYEESDITSETRADTAADSIRTCLRAGEVPDMYKIVDVEIVEKRREVKEDGDDGETAQSPYLTPVEAEERAAEGFFVRDPERNTVICPASEVLRQKSIKKNGNIRYANKTACRRCPHRHKCISGRQDWKEIDFTKDQLEKPNRNWMKADGKDISQSSGKRKRKKWFLAETWPSEEVYSN